MEFIAGVQKFSKEKQEFDLELSQLNEVEGLSVSLRVFLETLFTKLSDS